MALGLEDLAVGHWTDPVGLTGCTVVVPPPGNLAAASVRGGGPGTRETDLLQPQAHVEGVSAVLLTGGSAFGLAAAQGVVDWCERRGLGYGRWGWGPLADLLAERFRVVLFDNRGIGGSEVPPGPYSVRSMAEDAVSVLDEARVGRAHVLGTSLGGMVAQTVAVESPSNPQIM